MRASGAANTLIFPTSRQPHGPVRAENTDGAGLIAALADLGVAGRRPDDRHGRRGRRGRGRAGGAHPGRREASASVARRPAVARAVRRRLPAKQQARVRRVTAWTAAALADALESADVLVSAVPAAAWADDRRPRRARRPSPARRRSGDGLRQRRRRSPRRPAPDAPATPTASACWSTRPPTPSRSPSARSRPLPPSSRRPPLKSRGGELERRDRAPSRKRLGAVAASPRRTIARNRGCRRASELRRRYQYWWTRARMRRS